VCQTQTIERLGFTPRAWPLAFLFEAVYLPLLRGPRATLAVNSPNVTSAGSGNSSLIGSCSNNDLLAFSISM
jgi:hypothetical protein